MEAAATGVSIRPLREVSVAAGGATVVSAAGCATAGAVLAFVDGAGTSATAPAAMLDVPIAFEEIHPLRRTCTHAPRRSTSNSPIPPFNCATMPDFASGSDRSRTSPPALTVRGKESRAAPRSAAAIHPSTVDWTKPAREPAVVTGAPLRTVAIGRLPGVARSSASRVVTDCAPTRCASEIDASSVAHATSDGETIAATRKCRVPLWGRIHLSTASPIIPRKR